MKLTKDGQLDSANNLRLKPYCKDRYNRWFYVQDRLDASPPVDGLGAKQVTPKPYLWIYRISRIFRMGLIVAEFARPV